MQPELTVVLLVDRQRRRGTACLASILAQDIIERIEVLLFDFAQDSELPLPGSDHPSVRTLPGPLGVGLGPVRAQAAALAQAPIIAYVEEHCAVFPGWARAVLDAHAREQAVGVGAEIHNYNPQFRISRIIELINYPAWLPPAQTGPTELMAGHNSSYRRDVLLAYGDALTDLIGSEVLLQWQLAADGHRLIIDSAVRVRHGNETDLRSICRGYYLWNRCFAPQRAHRYRWSRLARGLRIAATPLLPFVRWAKLMRYLVTARPGHVGFALLHVPLIVWIQAYAALGQAAGLLWGVGTAEVDFLRYECNAPRRIPEIEAAP